MSGFKESFWAMMPFTVIVTPDGGIPDREPAAGSFQLDIRHLLAATFSSLLASAVVGSIVVYGNLQAITPTLEHLNTKITECDIRTSRLDDRLDSRLIRIETRVDLLSSELRAFLLAKPQ